MVSGCRTKGLERSSSATTTIFVPAVAAAMSPPVCVVVCVVCVVASNGIVIVRVHVKRDTPSPSCPPPQPRVCGMRVRVHHTMRLPVCGGIVHGLVYGEVRSRVRLADTTDHAQEISQVRFRRRLKHLLCPVWDDKHAVFQYTDHRKAVLVKVLPPHPRCRGRPCTGGRELSRLGARTAAIRGGRRLL